MTLTLTLDLRVVAWWLVGISFFVAGILAVLGIVRVIGTARALAKKVDAFKDLPLLSEFTAVQARIERAADRIADIDLLVARLVRALESVRRSHRQLTAALAAAMDPYRVAGRDLRAIVGALAKQPTRYS